MPTTPNSPVSRSEETPTTNSKLWELKGELNRRGIDPDTLVLLFIGPGEMVFGEEVPWADESMYEQQGLPERVMLKNPKRFSRHDIPARTPEGEVIFQPIHQFGDFDFVHGGNVEFRHQGGFSISWLDEESQVSYLGTYASFLDSQKIASAQAAGIHIPNGPLPIPRKR